MKVELYNSVMWSELKTIIIFGCIFLGVVAVVIPTFIIPFFRSTEKEDRNSARFICVVFLIVVLFSVGYIIPRILDITQQSYIRYEGIITVDDICISSGGKNPYYATITLPNEASPQKYKIKCSYEIFSSVNEGTFYGYVVISKHTQLVLDWGVLQ